MITLLTLYHKLLPLVVNVVPIPLWEFFKILCVGTEVAEFKDMFFKARGETFKVIQADFKEKIRFTDETLMKSGLEKNEKRKM